MTLETLIRDLTKVHPQPKSYVRKLLTSFLLELKEEMAKKRECPYKPDGICMCKICFYNEGLDKAISLIDTKIGGVK